MAGGIAPLPRIWSFQIADGKQVLVARSGGCPRRECPKAMVSPGPSNWRAF